MSKSLQVKETMERRISDETLPKEKDQRRNFAEGKGRPDLGLRRLPERINKGEEENSTKNIWNIDIGKRGSLFAEEESKLSNTRC